MPNEVTSLSGSVIQGTYDEYIVSGLFATDYKYEALSVHEVEEYSSKVEWCEH